MGEKSPPAELMGIEPADRHSQQRPSIGSDAPPLGQPNVREHAVGQLRVPRPEQAAVPARDQVDIPACGLESVFGQRRRGVPPVKFRHGDQVANAVTIEVGRWDEMARAHFGLQIWVHRAHPTRPAGRSVDQLHAFEMAPWRGEPGGGDDHLGPAVAVQVHEPGPFERIVVNPRTICGERHGP